MSVPAKLTKKQKKGIAFRERNTSKGRSKNGVIRSEDNDVPVLEEQVTLDVEGTPVEVEKVVEGKKSKPAAQVHGSSDPPKGEWKADEEIGRPTRRKRKADVEADVAEEGKQVAKRKKFMDEAAGTSENQVAPTPKPDIKQRFILFVGNLKYTTSVETITKHFSACDPPPAIRLLTPRSTAGKSTHKSKGCAFLEFTHRNALQQALKLHQSELEGRMINVELTAGGGGKSDTRLEKVKQRNKQLLEQRKERVGKAAATDSTSVPTLPDRPQRYSATSGIEQAPTIRQTWTVGDADNVETHRGGRKHTKRSKSRLNVKTWGTGVNAIPVG